MRTDTQRLDWLIDATETQSYDAGERLQAAFTLGLSGRVAIDAAMGAKLIEPGEPMPELTAIDLAVAEVGRIRNVKVFSEERDDGYTGQELVWASVAYLTPGDERHDHGGGPEVWPWDVEFWKPSPDDRKKELTKGIALALCELDRVIRAERRARGPDQCVVDGVLRPQPREFKVGDRVTYEGKLGTIRHNDGDQGFGQMWGIRLDDATSEAIRLAYASELEHADD